jgi:hypothetical protein
MWGTFCHFAQPASGSSVAPLLLSCFIRRYLDSNEHGRTGGEGRILTRSCPCSSVLSLTCANNPMNAGDSAVSPVLTPSTCSPFWPQFLSKTDTKDTKTSRERPVAERVCELQTGLNKFQFRKILFVSYRIECHETIRLRQRMRSNNEISKQTPRPFLHGSSSPLCVPRKPPASLKPYALLKLEIDVDACIRQKAVHKGFRGLRIG